MSIHLVPIALEHAAAVQVLASDPRIAATSNVPHPYPPDGATTWIRFTNAQRELGLEMNFAIVDEGDLPVDSRSGHPEQRRGVLVGVCGVLSIGGERLSGEVGYWIGVPYWGRGYASTAVCELLRIAFAERRLEQVRSSCLVRNRASFRVLEKAGFRLVGYGSHESARWTPQDRFALFELTRDEWRARAAETRGRGKLQGP